MTVPTLSHRRRNPPRRSPPRRRRPSAAASVFSPLLLLAAAAFPHAAIAQSAPPSPTVASDDGSVSVIGFISAEDIENCRDALKNADSDSSGHVDETEIKSFVTYFSPLPEREDLPPMVIDEYHALTNGSKYCEDLDGLYCDGIVWAGKMDYLLFTCNDLKTVLEDVRNTPPPTLALSAPPSSVPSGSPTMAKVFSVQVMFEGEKDRSQIEADGIPDDVVELVKRTLETFTAGNGAIVQNSTDLVREFVINEKGDCETDEPSNYCATFGVRSTFIISGSEFELDIMSTQVESYLRDEFDDISVVILPELEGTEILSLSFSDMGLPRESISSMSEPPDTGGEPISSSAVGGAVAGSLVAVAAMVGLLMGGSRVKARRAYNADLEITGPGLGASRPDYNNKTGDSLEGRLAGTVRRLPGQLSGPKLAASSSRRVGKSSGGFPGCTVSDTDLHSLASSSASSASSAGWTSGRGGESSSLNTGSLDGGDGGMNSSVSTLAAMGLASGLTHRLNKMDGRQSFVPLDGQDDALGRRSLDDHSTTSSQDIHEAAFDPFRDNASLPSGLNLTRDDLDAAIEAGDWAAVGASAALLASSEAGSVSTGISSRRSRSTRNTFQSEVDEARADELDELVATGNWEGVVLAAAKFETGGDDSRTLDMDGFNSPEGASESSPAPSSRAPTSAEIRAEVEDLVRRVVPEEIGHVDEMIMQFAGREEELLETLRTMQERQIATRARVATQRAVKNEVKRESRASTSPQAARGSGLFGMFGALKTPKPETPAAPTASQVPSVNLSSADDSPHVALERAIEGGQWDAMAEAAATLQKKTANASANASADGSNIFQATRRPYQPTDDSFKLSSRSTTMGLGLGRDNSLVRDLSTFLETDEGTIGSCSLDDGKAAQLDRMIERGDWDGVIETADAFKKGTKETSPNSKTPANENAFRRMSSRFGFLFGKPAASPDGSNMPAGDPGARGSDRSDLSSLYSDDASGMGTPGTQDEDALREEQDALAQAELWSAIAAQSRPSAIGDIRGANEAAEWAISRRLVALENEDDVENGGGNMI
eukprot:CAMPEP_0194296268 /NCGR_PEP_ID=MMETSP0169-20130528/55650_1 /TAXON_ID=218684 /ORGANISM="Corethron pennatum, Strain L29A3" /LENGTH=1055 /DNA_ID=CAMNT_0039045687 /DNA_START=221 /DNA_END=3388 /DNA_ORIENTATION=-